MNAPLSRSCGIAGVEVCVRRGTQIQSIRGEALFLLIRYSFGREAATGAALDKGTLLPAEVFFLLFLVYLSILVFGIENESLPSDFCQLSFNDHKRLKLFFLPVYTIRRHVDETITLDFMSTLIEKQASVSNHLDRSSPLSVLQFSPFNRPESLRSRPLKESFLSSKMNSRERPNHIRANTSRT